MALPSSGQISIGDIRTEIGSSSGSLRTLSAAASKSTPDAISEFYGYSHATLTSFSSSFVSNFSGVCSATINQTYYHDGILTNPDVGDTVYSNSSGTTYLSSGYYLLGPIGDEFMQVGSSGTVSSVDVCFGGP